MKTLPLSGLVIVALASTAAFAVQVNFPKRVRARIVALVDEAGDVLFDTAHPGKVEVVNLPGAPVAPLAPTSAGALVTVGTGGRLCTNGAFAFDALNRDDGTSAPFSIPPGSELIVTSLELEATGATGSNVAGHGAGIAVVRGQGSTFNTLIGNQVGEFGASNSFSVNVTIPSGAPVKAGATVCAHAADFTARQSVEVTGALHGFLVPVS